jgi:hypothetical protein
MGLFSKLYQWWMGTKTPSKLLIEHIDYVLGEYVIGDGSEPISTVKLLTTAYRGVEYCYLNVRVSEHGGTGQLAFKYSFLDTAHFDVAALKVDRDFVTVAGLVLESILLREGTTNNDTLGTHAPQEPDL